ncbi:MAG: RadC family protein [Christensenellales bacterium]
MMHTNHRERMRQRVLNEGLENFQEHEILEFLLYPFVPRKDTNPIAHELIARFGSLAGVLESDYKALKEVPNMTHNAALFLSSMPQIVKKYNFSKFGPKPDLSTHGRVKEYCRTLLSDLNYEVVYLLAVDNKGKLINKSLIGQGTIDDCKLMTREMVMMCHNLASPNVYIVHNHPSGDANPSLADMEFTKWASAALEMMGVRLIDHLIVAKQQVFSFEKDGKLNEFREKYYQLMDSNSMINKY